VTRSISTVSATLALSGLVVLSAALAGCRGEASEDPPFHLAPDMDWQSKRMAQQESPLDDEGKLIFADKRSSRPLVPGTVAYGKLKDDDAFYRGVDANGKHVRRMPVDAVVSSVEGYGGATRAKSIADVAKRGEERFNIYCAPCHDASGNGNGMIIQHAAGAFPPPTLLSAPVVRDMPDGQIFETISHGVRNMPGYATQLTEADRWAIVLWVRILGKSQGATIEDVPPANRSTIAEPDVPAMGSSPAPAPSASSAPAPKEGGK
jgi:mono/diheme cytochrome c family protein